MLDCSMHGRLEKARFEVNPEHLRDGEDDLPVRHRPQDRLVEPLRKRHRPLRVAGGAEVPPLAGVGQEVLVTTVGAADAGKTLAEIATGKIVPDDLSDYGPEATVGDGVFLGVAPFELIVMPADELVEGCFSGPSWPIDTFRALHHKEQVEQLGCLTKKYVTVSDGYRESAKGERSGSVERAMPDSSYGL
jgi:hypothetical protein